jgi:hypothetical protein
MDRLLSDQEFEDAYESAENKGYDIAVAKAQDAKTANYYETVIIPQKIKEAIERAKKDKCQYGINPCLACESDGWGDTLCRIDCPDWAEGGIDKGVVTPLIREAEKQLMADLWRGCRYSRHIFNCPVCLVKLKEHRGIE